MQTHNVTLIKGDGTGPELAEAARRCLEATGVSFKWDIQEAGVDCMEKYGTPLPDGVMASLRNTRVGLKAPITTPIGHGFRSVNVALRKEFDLYACLRPCKSYPGVRSRYENIDLVVVRENTEGLYAGIEFKRDSEDVQKVLDFFDGMGYKMRRDSGIGLKPISEFCSRRIVEFAFKYAVENGRKKVTAVHKANIQKFTDGLFLEVARDVAKKYPSIEFEDRLVDNMCMQLVQKPELYDIMVLPNLYGDIISDVCAGLVGGLGVAPGANIGDDGMVMCEATHGSAPKYTGQNKVNPSALILSGVLLLRHLKEKDAADRLEAAVATVIKEGKHVTYDMKENRDDPSAVGTSEMADAIIDKIASPQTT